MARTYGQAGGGYRYEYWVGAYYLAAMFGGGHPEGDVGRVKRVEFQRGTLGDVTVRGRAPGGMARLDLQVKTSLSVSATQGDFAKVVRQMHRRVTTEPLQRGVDHYGIAVQHRSGPLGDLAALAGRASKHGSAEAFYETADALNAGERRVLGVVQGVLADEEGVADAREAAWRLLGSGLVVLGLDPETPEGAGRARLRGWVECRVGAPERRAALEDALYAVASEHDVEGGDLDRGALERALLARGHRMSQDADAALVVTLQSMAAVPASGLVAAVLGGEIDRFDIDLRPFVSDTLVLDPGAAVAALAAADGALRQAVEAQGDREVVLAGRAHIPFAALVGAAVTDRGDARVLDWHPPTESWSWPVGDDAPFPPLRVEASGRGRHWVVLMTLSFWTTPESDGSDRGGIGLPPAIQEAVGIPDRVAHLSHPELTPEGLRFSSVLSQAQARAYGDAFRRVLDAAVDSAERVDVFLAGPLSAAFEVGRRVTRTFHPPVTVWNRAGTRYGWGIELNPRSTEGSPLSPRAVVTPTR